MLKSQIIESKGLVRKIELNVQAEIVQNHFDKQFKNLQKEVNIPGFRPGKANLELVKKQHYQQAWKQVLDDLFKEFYPQALTQNKVEPASSPKLVDVDLKESAPCKLVLQFEVHPEVKIVKYKGLEVKKEKKDVTDKDCEEALNRLRTQIQTQEKSEKLPELNDGFAEKFKMKSLDELKTRIKEDLTHKQKHEAQENEENSIIDRFIEANPVELPQSLIEEHQASLMENSRKRLESYGVDAQKQQAFLKEKQPEFEKEAKRSLHASYLMDKLTEDLKIEPTLKDIEKSLKESFPDKSPTEMEKDLKKQNYWNQFLFNLKRKQALDILLEKAKFI